MADFRKWKIDFDGNDSALVERRHVPDPPGYDSSTGRELVSSPSQAKAQNLQLKQAALYGRATGQLKNIGMLAFMMWMSGSQIHLFSIMMTVSGIYQPLLAIIKSHEAFPAAESEEGRLNTMLPRALYCLIQAGGLAFALWKVNGMGLLPTHPSDYVSAMSLPTAEQTSRPGLAL